MADDGAPPATWTRPVLRPWHWLLIACIDIIGPFSTDSYIPNLPEMARELDAPTWLAGLTLQANWLAKGVGTLAIGPLSDSPRVGRRGALLGAFVFYCAGTVGCSLVARNRGGASALVAFRVQIKSATRLQLCFENSTRAIDPSKDQPNRLRFDRAREFQKFGRDVPNQRVICTQVAFRVVQGLGESATTVCSAVARDVLADVDERMRVMAILGSLRPLAIVAAPSVGGLAGSLFGWRYVFRALAVWGALLFVGTLVVLPETRPPDAAAAGGAPVPAKAGATSGYAVVLARLRRGAAGAGSDDERFAVAALLYVTFGMSGVMCFLSNLAPLLEVRYAVKTVMASLLIGSLPAVIIFTNGSLAFLIGKRKDRGVAPPSPGYVLRVALAILAASAAFDVACAAGPRALFREDWPPLHGALVLYLLGESLGAGPCMAGFMQPFGDHAGAASSVQLVSRTAFSTAYAFAITIVVGRRGVFGLFCALAATASGCQLARLFLPRLAPPPPPDGYTTLGGDEAKDDDPAAPVV